jgi:hypothetical protein
MSDAEILKFTRTRLDDLRQICDNRYELLIVGPLLATVAIQTRSFTSDHSGINTVPGSAEWKSEELQEAMNQDMFAGVYIAGTRATCPSKEEEMAEFAPRHSNNMP